AAGSEGKSRILQGPLAKDWANHRDTIIRLYRHNPLKKVSEIMRKDYGFSASKRMYDKRFREWNVFKNVNSDEKERPVRRIESSAPPSHLMDRDTMSREDLRRTLRLTRNIPHGMRRTSAVESSYSPSQTTNQAVTASHQRPSWTGRTGLSISDLTIKKPGTNHEDAAPKPPSEADSPEASTISSPDVICVTPTSSCGWSDDHLSVPSNAPVARSATGSPGPSLSIFKDQIRALADTPPPSLSPDPKSRTLEIITLNIRAYYDWQLQNIPEGVLPDDYLGHRSTEASTEYWSTVKSAIYLIKISAGSLNTPTDQRAYPALAEAGNVASEAMATQPFDFLRNVLSTLSPANTSARPELRTIILQFLAREARKKHSENHPLARIFHELQNDEDCQEISRRALQCMLDVFADRLGRSRAVTFKLLDSLATLLRRNGELDAALEIVVELLKSCRQVFGPDSDQARTVENELAHFYMVLDDCDTALEHCMMVVRRPQAAGVLPEGEPVFYQDEIAAHTMEDISEIYQRRGDIEQSITWLERAGQIALKVWGPKSIATGHIIDKMTNLQRQFGKDLLRSAMLWEKSI
ncbi:hypothetical protein B0T17DRAFT_472364, partial [Bombardia bombarda]